MVVGEIRTIDYPGRIQNSRVGRKEVSYHPTSRNAKSQNARRVEPQVLAGGYVEGKLVPGASSLKWSFVKGPVVLVVEGSKWGLEMPF